MKPARPLALLALSLAALPAPAGILNGVVLENQTSRPLARAQVYLYRLEGNQLKSTKTVRSSRTGQFLFRDLPGGYYQIGASRPGFAETRYGQRGNSSAGAPILLDQDASQFIELRLKRLGAVTGRVTDENGVGLPGVSVSAYTAGPLMRLVNTAASDDRGIYRVTGLSPGRHYIRTGGARLDDGLNLLPTYHPFTSTLVRDARIVSVDLDADTPDVDIQPVPGRLANLTVKVQTCIGAAQVTLSSDTGRRQAIAPCNLGPVSFDNLASGEYEVLAEGVSDGQPVGLFETVFLDNSREIGMSLRGLPDLLLTIDNAAGLPLSALDLSVRRRDPAGFGPARNLDSNRITLPPGFWQIAARPPVSHYLTDIKSATANYRISSREPHPEWFDLHVTSFTPATITLSAHAAQLSGRVLAKGQPAVSAPVYLLAVTQPTLRRMNGARAVYTDSNGYYSFSGLAPGRYLAVSSFDIAEITEDSMTASQAQSITVEEGRPVTQDLDLIR